jgi:hypothetical protein
MCCIVMNLTLLQLQYNAVVPLKAITTNNTCGADGYVIAYHPLQYTYLLLYAVAVLHYDYNLRVQLSLLITTVLSLPHLLRNCCTIYTHLGSLEALRQSEQ